jgi:hypothetical protein
MTTRSVAYQRPPHRSTNNMPVTGRFIDKYQLFGLVKIAYQHLVRRLCNWVGLFCGASQLK